jgi:hypothetical protein
LNCAVDTAYRKATNGLDVEGSCPDLFLRNHGNNQVGVAKKRIANGALSDVVQSLSLSLSLEAFFTHKNSLNYRCKQDPINVRKKNTAFPTADFSRNLQILASIL